uniref:Uncharacterized protein n=1 Tax=Leersia perrieri TaxID=77586 RepID=A0A0D9XMJ2_9ORYZ
MTFLMSFFGILVPGVPANCIGDIADAPAAGKDDGGAATGGTTDDGTGAAGGIVAGAAAGAGVGSGGGGGRGAQERKGSADTCTINNHYEQAILTEGT